MQARAPDFVLRSDRRRCLWIGQGNMPAEAHQFITKMDLKMRSEDLKLRSETLSAAPQTLPAQPLLPQPTSPKRATAAQEQRKGRWASFLADPSAWLDQRAAKQVLSPFYMFYLLIEIYLYQYFFLLIC